MSSEIAIIQFKEGLHMKVVVIRSPKFISGILRVIFRIKKEEE